MNKISQDALDAFNLFCDETAHRANERGLTKEKFKTLMQKDDKEKRATQ
jgi:hypothetical protein